MLFLLPLTVLAVAASGAVIQKKSASAWDISKFNSFITFGDSYTDENRLDYFVFNNGSAPPAGTFLPESFSTAGGGRTWPRYVIQYTGETTKGIWTPQMTLYNYAVAGAVCSNHITPRSLALIDADFPSVLEYEIPAYKADLTTNRNGTSTAYYTPGLSSADSVYALWIGTNDLGNDAFITSSQVRGTTLSTYTACVYTALDELYATGARNIVLMNVIPLNLAALYGNKTTGGVGPNHYWPDKPSNHTQIADTMHEFVTSVDAIFKYQTPFEVLVANRYPGANVALFDVWQLISDIYDSPSKYLNGTKPANVTGFEHHCNINDTVCENTYGGTSPDSFLFYDELHPSEQTDRIIASHFVDVISGSSKYATYY